MNELIEKMFVKTFVCKKLQDRIFFELSNNRSRNKAISRFAHINDELIELKYVMFQSNKLTSSEIETKLMSHCDKSKKVYIISTNEFDGEFVILREGIQLCMNDYMPSILVCNPNCVFIKEETEYGAPMKYILIK